MNNSLQATNKCPINVANVNNARNPGTASRLNQQENDIDGLQQSQRITNIIYLFINFFLLLTPKAQQLSPIGQSNIGLNLLKLASDLRNQMLGINSSSEIGEQLNQKGISFQTISQPNRTNNCRHNTYTSTTGALHR